jgi:hypothetical protein
VREERERAQARQKGKQTDKRKIERQGDTHSYASKSGAAVINMPPIHTEREIQREFTCDRNRGLLLHKSFGV